jgi:TetR/AcrR family transcriptional regulator
MRVVPDAIAGKLEAAAAVFADRGFDQTRIEDVAEATGVPRATLYYYFSGKEDILAWILRRMLAAAAEAVAGAASGPGSARERLEAVIRQKLRVMADHPNSCRAMLADFGRADRIPELAAAIQEGFHVPVRRLLAEGEADGSLRPVSDPETAASALYGAVTTAGFHFLLADNRLDPDRVAAEVWPLLAGGLAPSLTAGGKRNIRGSPRPSREHR